MLYCFKKIDLIVWLTCQNCLYIANPNIAILFSRDKQKNDITVNQFLLFIPTVLQVEKNLWLVKCYTQKVILLEENMGVGNAIHPSVIYLFTKMESNILQPIHMILVAFNNIFTLIQHRIVFENRSRVIRIDIKSFNVSKTFQI